MVQNSRMTSKCRTPSWGFTSNSGSNISWHLRHTCRIKRLPIILPSNPHISQHNMSLLFNSNTKVTPQSLKAPNNLREAPPLLSHVFYSRTWDITIQPSVPSIARLHRCMEDQEHLWTHPQQWTDLGATQFITKKAKIRLSFILPNIFMTHRTIHRSRMNLSTHTYTRAPARIN